LKGEFPPIYIKDPDSEVFYEFEKPYSIEEKSIIKLQFEGFFLFFPFFSFDFRKNKKKNQMIQMTLDLIKLSVVNQQIYPNC